MTVNQEAIPNAELFLKKKISTYAWGTPFGLNRLPIVLYEEVAKVMDEYSSSLLKENEELKENWKMTEENYQDDAIKWINERAKLQKEVEYWKQRCEAAEAFADGEYWNKELYEKWQQLKQQPIK